MSLAPISIAAAEALFKQVEFADTNTTVTVKKNTATLACHGKELVQLTFDPKGHMMQKPTLKIKNDGFFTNVNRNRINAVLRRAGHEMLYCKNYCWTFESSQAPFGAGTSWKGIKL